jgi:hypothetical protein
MSCTEVKKTKHQGRSRRFTFTINNYTNGAITWLSNESGQSDFGIKYLIYGVEVGKQGTPHLQGYIEFKSAHTITALQKGYFKQLGAAIFVANGSAQQNYDYCTKDGNYTEFGKLTKQGERNDLNKIKDEIVDGAKVDDIVMDRPMVYHQYGRTLHKIEDLVMRKKFRTEMTKCIWYWGKTSTGKSHNAFKGFDPSTHYVHNLNEQWWDGYTQQETVIFNEFRGQIKYNELLDFIDKWPKTVKRRNREPIPFTSKMIIITCPMRPQELYGGDELDNIDQLLRRIEIIELTVKHQEIPVVEEIPPLS